MGNDKFDFTYAAPTEKERQEIEAMRRAYSSSEQTKQSALEKMRRLNRKVRLPAEIVAVVLGVVGVLSFGTGLSMVMGAIAGGMALGVAFGAVGIVLLVFIRRIYRFILNKRKEKYGKEILNIAERLLNEENRTDNVE